MINTVALCGRLVREPENRHTQSGKSVTNFTIAVDNGKDREADFIDCVAWKGTADFVSTWFHKGMKIDIVGRLSTRNWEDKNGNKRKSTEVVALNVEFADGKRENTDRDTALTDDDFTEVDEDSELPF